MSSFEKNIVLCGVGGQGTVLASKVIAAAAMKKGYNVMSAETIGMAQRGGSVFSHLRIGEDIYSPMIGEHSADLIFGFEPGETVRMLPFLKEGGSVIVADRVVMPVTASLSESNYNSEQMIDFLRSKVSNLSVVKTDEALKELGSGKVLNVLMIGAAVSSGALGMTAEEIFEVLKERLPEKVHDLNYRALTYYK